MFKRRSIAGKSPLAFATSDDEMFIAQARREDIADVAVSATSPGMSRLQLSVMIMMMCESLPPQILRESWS